MFNVPGVTVRAILSTLGLSLCGWKAITAPEPSMGFGKYSSASMFRINENPAIHQRKFISLAAKTFCI